MYNAIQMGQKQGACFWAELPLTSDRQFILCESDEKCDWTFFVFEH